MYITKLYIVSTLDRKRKLYIRKENWQLFFGIKKTTLTDLLVLIVTGIKIKII